MVNWKRQSILEKKIKLLQSANSPSKDENKTENKKIKHQTAHNINSYPWFKLIGTL